MTDCNSKPMFFSSLGRKKIVADFTGGTLTSDAGGLLLREVERLVQGPNVRFVVTNLTDRTPNDIYDGLYTARGDMTTRQRENHVRLGSRHRTHPIANNSGNRSADRWAQA
ncbi:MAG: transposase [Planctomycetes bacterium]|nr:transposase [Planctomycetota bacterium]